MSKAAIQWALRSAGVEGALSVTVAAELAEPIAGDTDITAELSGILPLDPADRGSLARSRVIEHGWGLPVLADAELCAGFGDLCGRRVA